MGQYGKVKMTNFGKGGPSEEEKLFGRIQGEGRIGSY